MEFKNIVPGMTFEKEFIVEEGDTASHFGNDKVPVFASPRLISWIEGTAIGTVAPFLPEGWETVGTTFDLAHLAATPVGMKVRVVTEVTEVKGKMLTYSVKAYDEVDKICEGTHGRAIIELDKFLSRVNKKGTKEEARQTKVWSASRTAGLFLREKKERHYGKENSGGGQ